MEAISNFKDPSFESKLPFITILSVTLITILVGLWKYSLSHVQGRKLPPGKLGLPLIGESISFFKAHKQNKSAQWIEARIMKYGPIFKTSLMGSKAIVVTGQAGNRFIFSGSENGLAGNQPASAVAILGKHSIFELSGYRHGLLRGAIMSFLRPESIQRYVGKIDLLVKQQLLQELSGKDSVQVVKLMKKVTFKVTCTLLYSLREGKEKDALLEDFLLVLKGIWSIPLDFPGTAFRKALQARGRICKLFSNLIAKRKQELESGSLSSHEDIISTLVILRDEDGKPLLEEEIVDNLIAVMIASHESSTVLLSLIVRCLGRDANVLDKVLKEQKEVVKARERSGGKISWREIQMMKYTWSVAQELMRLIPPVFGNFRCAWRDTTFGGFDIPKGWQVFWVAPGTHMDKNIFQDPENFDPSRFDALSKSIPPYTYIAFGAGPKICPGVDFARMDVLLIIHHLITNYRWTEVIAGEPITRDPMPFPAMGLPIKLFPRENL